MDATLAFAVELEGRDEVVAALLANLAELDRRIGSVRTRAEEVLAFRERLPGDRSHLAEALAAAERELEETRQAFTSAREAVERARSEDARATARRHEAHAASDLHTNEERRERLAARREELSREALEAESESAAVEAAARALSDELELAPRVARPAPPAAGIAGALEWAARAHAAVVLVRSGLETERERIVREANELAASALGEPLSATSVALVRRRLEERLG
jgi:DNA repair exonuclease SbcCD ATPase subunit